MKLEFPFPATKVPWNVLMIKSVARRNRGEELWNFRTKEFSLPGTNVP